MSMNFYGIIYSHLRGYLTLYLVVCKIKPDVYATK